MVIGIEIHCQLNTNTKIYSSASTPIWAEPNTQANIVDPSHARGAACTQQRCGEKAVMFGLGVNAEIGMMNAFDRKIIFIPTCQKGYQISQMAHPIVGTGYIDIVVNEGEKTNTPNVFTLPVLA